MSYNRNYKKATRSYSKKANWKTILISILVVTLALGGVVALTNVFNTDSKVIHPAYALGSVSAEDGSYVKSNSSIYTKELIECEGLALTLDFDAYVTYRVFFYDADKTFIQATDDLTVEDKFEVLEGASYVRVVITPEWDVINADVEEGEANIEIKWHQVNKYAKQLTMTVTVVEAEADEEIEE